MNVLRNLFMIGVAVTAYLMIFNWQQDYYVNVPSDTTESESEEGIPHLDAQDSIADVITDTVSHVPILDQEVSSSSTDLPAVERQVEPTPSDTANINRSKTERYISVTTDTLKLKIDLLGGDIVETKLRKYPVAVDKPDRPFELLDDRDGQLYIAQSGIIGKSGKDLNAQQGQRPLYSADKSQFLMEGEALKVVLEYQGTDGVFVKKYFKFSQGDHLIDISYDITNNGSEGNWIGTPFSQLKRQSFPDPSTGGFTSATTFLGAAFWRPEEKFNKLEFDDIQEDSLKGVKSLDEKIRGGWIGVIQHYFLVAWVPESGELNRYYAKYRSSNDEYIVGATSATVSVAPGETITTNAIQLYVGPKLQDRLADISDGLELSVDYGILFFISSLLFTTLKGIYGFVGNWGWAIILLTVLIKAIFYVPSAMSYRSMANIRRVQPELLRLREKYSEDKQKLSQEMMKLYQKEKINPLGGCLPILLQMPVFIALYWALLETVELRHAEFIFWIDDLSSMDPYFILPLLMGASMFAQTALNPTPPDPMQAKVMKFMPVIFTVFFLFFPSGLVLYWLTNNILSIAQQWYITRKIEREGA